MEEQIFFENKFIFFQEKNNEDFFYGSLIYIFEHNQNGAIGVIVNKLISIDENQIFKSLGLTTSSKKKSLLNGGPVDINKLFIIHNKTSHKESILTSAGIGLTSNIELIKTVHNDDALINYKFALGYCGWDAGQLDYEISLNSWLVLDVDPNIIFTTETEQLVSEISKIKGFNINQIQNTEIVTKH